MLKLERGGLLQVGSDGKGREMYMKRVLYLILILAFVVSNVGCNSNESSEDNREKINENFTSSSTDSLIQSDKVNYYKFESNQEVSFDIDNDGTDEKIKYITQENDGLEFGQVRLLVNNYEAIDLEGIFIQEDYFLIIKFSDKHGTNMNMIGIIDYGPSNDYTTSFYAIRNNGEKSLVNVGCIGGEIIPLDEYSESNMQHFNYMAVIRENQGIEAPTRLDVMSQTWFGRSIYTFDEKISRLVRNTAYMTSSELTTLKDITIYKEKSLDSTSSIIKAGETVQLISTDNREWVEMYTNSSGKVWYNLNYFTLDSFEGYVVFD